MNNQFFRWTVVAYVALMLMACQPIQPVTTEDVAAPTLATYTDQHGFFTAQYPADWVVKPHMGEEMPVPHVAIGSHMEIMEKSSAWELLPEDQIGVGIMLLPRDMFAEAGLTADTPLEEAARLILTGMGADDPEAVAEMVAQTTFEEITLANGIPAVLGRSSAPTEAYVMTLSDQGDSLYLFTSQILALDYENAVLEAQVMAIVNSIEVTASTDEIMAFIMGKMGASQGGSEAPTATFTATEYAYDGPDSIPSGLTRIELVNAGEQEHMLWLAKLDEGKSFTDIMEVFATYETNPQNPAWMVWYGGIGADPGQSSAYTIDLVPGNYALFSMSSGEDGVPDAAKGMEATLTVTEAVANNAAPPVADLRTELVDFSYIIEGTPTAGPQIIEVANTGMEPHEVILLKMAAGAVVQDALDFMMAGDEADGAPPFEFSGGAGPMHAGLTAWYEADLEAGEYGLICFIGSPDNEFAPHFVLGMVRQITVETME